MDKIKIEEKIKDIDLVFRQVLSDFSKKENIQLGLLSGLSGICLSCVVSVKERPTQRHKEQLLQIITIIFSRINDKESFPAATYGNGIQGTAWLINYMNELLPSNEYCETLRAIDLLAFKSAKKCIKNENLDFLYGSFGDMFYLNERIVLGKTEGYLSELVNVIAEKSKTDGDGVYWYDNFEWSKNNPQNEIINLSLSHGHASKITVLAKIANSIGYTSELKVLIEGSVNFLLSFKNRNADGWFPSFIRDNVPEYNS